MKRYLLLAPILMGIAAYAYYANYEPDQKIYSVRGIDVSHHQGAIDWLIVRTDNVSFAYIKATEGGDFHDPRFKENWVAADEAGLPRGAYHFYTLCKTSEEQAQNFIAIVPTDANALPPVIDLEYVGNCAARPASDAFVRGLKNYIARIESHYKTRPIFYTTPEFYKDYIADVPSLRAYPLWVRTIARKPDSTFDWVMWQYHNRGTVKGIHGPVDLSVLPERAYLARMREGAQL